MPPGNYSGITWLGDNHYAVVTDKAESDGFYLFDFDVDHETGHITGFTNHGFMTDSLNLRSRKDCEGICYVPHTQTLWISSEDDQEILEYQLDGTRTGRALTIPTDLTLPFIWGNYGFEALTYCETTRELWTCTESQTRTEGKTAAPSRPDIENLIWLQSFSEDDLQPARRFRYRMERPSITTTTFSAYAFGIPELLALPDGRLLVMEREVYIGRGMDVFLSVVENRLYLVDPNAPDADTSATFESTPLPKQLLHHGTTTIQDFANYEGLCLGPTLDDGSRLLLMVSDSQDRYKEVIADWVQALSLRIEPTQLLPAITAPDTLRAPSTSAKTILPASGQLLVAGRYDHMGRCLR